MLVLVNDKLIHKARGFALCVHNNQRDGGNNCYMDHIAATVNGVAHLDSETVTIIATLHDVLEKAENPSDWAGIFTKNFSMAVTETLFNLWHRQEEPYSWSIERVIAGGWRSMAVKLSELYHNLDTERYRRVLTADEQKRQNQYVDAYTLLHKAWREKFKYGFTQCTGLEIVNCPL